MNPSRQIRLLLSLICLLTSTTVVAANGANNNSKAAAPNEPGGLREVIPPKYQRRYQEWKAEFLATDIGKA